MYRGYLPRMYLLLCVLHTCGDALGGRVLYLLLGWRVGLGCGPSWVRSHFGVIAIGSNLNFHRPWVEILEGGSPRSLAAS